MPEDKLLELAKIKEIERFMVRNVDPEGHRSEDDILRAKCVPIESLYEFKRVHKTARGFTACCPFDHIDKTPSFSVKNNRYMCFSCSEKGDSIDFMMKMEDLKFTEAIGRLING